MSRRGFVLIPFKVPQTRREGNRDQREKDLEVPDEEGVLSPESKLQWRNLNYRKGLFGILSGGGGRDRVIG